MEHPLVDCVGHLTGRLIGRPVPYPIDMERVIEAAVRKGTMLEINASPDRRDLSDATPGSRPRPESRSASTLTPTGRGPRLLAYGVATARRAWLTRGQVANTRSWREFARLRKRAKRKRALNARGSLLR